MDKQANYHPWKTHIRSKIEIYLCMYQYLLDRIEAPIRVDRTFLWLSRVLILFIRGKKNTRLALESVRNESWIHWDENKKEKSHHTKFKMQSQQNIEDKKKNRPTVFLILVPCLPMAPTSIVFVPAWAAAQIYRAIWGRKSWKQKISKTWEE